MVFMFRVLAAVGILLSSFLVPIQPNVTSALEKYYSKVSHIASKQADIGTTFAILFGSTFNAVLVFCVIGIGTLALTTAIAATLMLSPYITVLLIFLIPLAGFGLVLLPFLEFE